MENGAARKPANREAENVHNLEGRTPCLLQFRVKGDERIETKIYNGTTQTQESVGQLEKVGNACGPSSNKVENSRSPPADVV